jgi:UDP-N-acetylglucosamine 2-epimerase (non-hydrolysing)
VTALHSFVPKIAYVVGARPNFVKMAPVIAATRARIPRASHVVIHTGQHYDREMSEIFVEQLGMPDPDYLLGVGSGTHAQQTARVMERLEPVLEEERPDLVLVPGDVNSTLAAALVAVKLGIPSAHVEAGLRSFDRSMPEEINRIVADAFAEILFVHSDEAIENLAREGIDETRIHFVGNTMIDTLVACEPRFRTLDVATSLGLARGRYVLVTLHRPSLVDGPLLDEVMDELDRLAERIPVVFPVHPRTRASLDGRSSGGNVVLLDPLGYLEFLSLEADAGAVLTDSGGVQEETSFLGIPCYTLRTTTERPVTVRLGTNTMLGLEPRAIRRISTASADRRPGAIPTWDGRAAERAAGVIDEFLVARGKRPEATPHVVRRTQS